MTLMKNFFLDCFLNLLLITQGYIEKIEKENIDAITESLSSKKNEIIDDLGIINGQLNQFCLSTGFGIAKEN